MNVNAETALHEAGHAVVAASLGIGVRVVRAAPCELPMLKASAAEPFGFSVERRPLAGITLLWTDDSLAASPDAHLAIDVSGLMAVMFAGLPPRDEYPSHDMAAALKRIPAGADQPTRMKAAVALSARILAANVAAVGALARALMEKGVVTGEELAGLLGTVQAACGCTPPVGVTMAWRCRHGHGAPVHARN